MGESNTERQRKLRAKREAEGQTQMRHWVDRETLGRLETMLPGLSDKSKDERINKALVELFKTQSEHEQLIAAFDALQAENEALKAKLEPQPKPARVNAKKPTKGFDINSLDATLAAWLHNLTIEGLWNSDPDMKATALQLMGEDLQPVDIINAVVELTDEQVESDKRTRLRKKLADWKRASKKA